jgi:uncharacterized repeat protein (TIGR03803 family)
MGTEIVRAKNDAVLRNTATAYRVWMLLLCALLMTITGTTPTEAQTLTTLYTFLGSSDGGEPAAGLVMNAHGDLYGTTSQGGKQGSGTVFEVTPQGTESVLYSFCLKSGCSDGSLPLYGSLVMDSQGNLYGTTIEGGSYKRGTVFKVTPSGAEIVLHSFPFIGLTSELHPRPKDGESPYGGLVLDAQGNLYGATSNGGAYDQGMIFKVAQTGEETVLYAFAGGSDGAAPWGSLVFDGKGNLYGTTTAGGEYGQGTVFELTSTGKETVLHSFAGPPDGALPIGNLIFDAQGNLYGTTEIGSPYECTGYGCGTVFKLAPNGTETILHNFTGGADGAFPSGGLIVDADGNYYGTAGRGGGYDHGTVFEITSAGTLTVLYTFTGGTDGGNPYATLIFDSQNNLYGTTGFYGSPRYHAGTVFKLSP